MDRRRYMDKAEVQQIRQNAEANALLDLEHGRITGPIRWLVVDLALVTGLRVAELAAIRVEDIDLRRRIITVTRVKKRQPKAESLAIGPDLAAHLKTYLAWRSACGHGSTGPLVVGKRGGLGVRGWEYAWHAARAAAGLPADYSIHSARHTCATHLLARTHDLRQVQKQLGHSSPATTANMYADVSEDRMRDGVTGLYD